MTDLTEKAPPLDDLIYGNHKIEDLMKEISERGKKLSATECCEYFCTPPGKKTLLVRALQGTERSLGHYNHNASDTLQYLGRLGRILSPRDDAALISAIISARPNQIVIISRDLLPQRPNFLKKGTTKRVFQEEDEPIDFAVDREIRKVRITDNFGGYHFQGHSWTNKEYKLIALIDIIRGCIYDAAIHTAIRVDCYAGKEPEKTGGIAGVTQMPSFHDSKKEYIGGFEGVPIYKKKPSESFNQGFEITASTTSPRELWDMIKFGREIPRRTQQRTGREQRWDHHFVFAYQRVAKEFKNQGYETIKPYPEPGAATIRLYWTIMHNCLAERWDEESRKIVLEQVTIPQAEHILWKKAGYTNMQRPSTRK